MTRSKKAEEKEFNKEARKYGLKSFLAKEFDEDLDLRKAFEAYVKSNEAKREDKFFSVNKDRVIYTNFLEEKSLEHYGVLSSMYEMSQVKIETQILFELTNPIPEISYAIYYDISTQGFLSGIYDIDEYELSDTIEKWHDIRRIIDKFVPYIEKRYPRWSNATKVEKQDFKKDIKKNFEELKILNIESEELDLLLSFVNNYGLNQIKSFKADYLLYLELPYINRKEIATKIIENSKV